LRADARESARNRAEREHSASAVNSISNVVLLAAFVIGAWLRFYNLGALEMSADEGASWGAASAPNIADVMTRQAQLNPGKLPIHDLLLHAWIAIFGASLPAMRALSALLGTLTILLVYFVAIEIFQTHESESESLPADDIRQIAAFSALLFAVNLIAVKYAREARMYPVMLAAVVTQVGIFLRSLRRGGIANWVALAILTAFAVGANFSVVLVPATEGLWLIRVLARAGWKASDVRARRAWFAMFALGAGGCVLAPILLSSFRATAVSTTGGIISWIKPPPFYAPVALFNKATGTFAFPLLALLAIWGSIQGWRAGARDAIAFSILWMWAPPILMMVASYTLTPIFIERYALSCFVPFFILAGLGILELLWPRYRIAALAIVVASSLGHFYSYQHKFHDAQYREAIAAADAALKPGETMTVVPSYAIEVLRYYLPKEHLERAIRHDPKSQTPAVLIVVDQNLAPDAKQKYRRDYPHMIVRLRGIAVFSRAEAPS
jgi:4-amino-4-deoxy-L-arabinose transferase-like glycosyltransferase